MLMAAEKLDDDHGMLELSVVSVAEPESAIDLRWHVLLTEPSCELKAAHRLTRVGFKPYVPLFTKTVAYRINTMFGRQLRERKITRSLFPGYLFIPLNMAWEFGAIWTTPGLRTGSQQNSSPFLKINDRHAIVSNEDIEKMRKVEAALANPANLGLPYKVGDKVKLIDGSFADLVAVISRLDDASRIEILMDMLGRQTKTFVTSKQIVASE